MVEYEVLCTMNPSNTVLKRGVVVCHLVATISSQAQQPALVEAAENFRFAVASEEVSEM